MVFSTPTLFCPRLSPSLEKAPRFTNCISILLYLPISPQQTSGACETNHVTCDNHCAIELECGLGLFCKWLQTLKYVVHQQNITRHCMGILKILSLVSQPCLFWPVLCKHVVWKMGMCRCNITYNTSIIQSIL